MPLPSDIKGIEQPINFGFPFTRVVVIESLEPDEHRTGTQLAEYLRPLCADTRSNVSVDYMACESALEFLALIKSMVTQAIENNEIPLLHVETHGDPVTGLEFANGSELPWSSLAEALAELNIACSFNLIAVVAACFGAYFLSQMNIIRPAPCYAFIAPSHEIDTGELSGGFFRFYYNLFTYRDVAFANVQLSKEHLSNGYWFNKTAEDWYEYILINFAQKFTTRQALDKWAKELQANLLELGFPYHISDIELKIRESCDAFLDERGFATYFSIDKWPEGRIRFSAVRRRAASKLNALRIQPQFIY